MARDVEQLVLTMSADIRRMEKALDRAQGKFDKTARDIERRQRELDKNLARMGEAAGAGLEKARTAIAAIGVGLSIREVQQYADAWTSAGNKLAAAGVATNSLVQRQNELADLANETRTGFTETVDLYAKLTRATSDLGVTSAEVARVTETVNKAFKAGGAAAHEQAAGILQLGQALGSGVLQGDELRSIRENAPLVAKAIASEFGVAVAGLKKLGEEGKLTSDRVFKALLNAGAEIDAQFSKTVPTIADSFARLQTEFGRYISTADKATSASAQLAGFISTVADNFALFADAAVVAASVLGGALAGRAIIKVVAGLASIATGATGATGALVALRTALAFVGGPWGAAITAIGAALGYMTLQTAKAKIEQAQLEANTKSANAALENAAKFGRTAGEVVGGMGDQAAAAMPKVTSFAGAVGELADQMHRLAAARKAEAVNTLLAENAKARADIAALEGRQQRSRNQSMALAAAGFGSGPLPKEVRQDIERSLAQDPATVAADAQLSARRAQAAKLEAEARRLMGLATEAFSQPEDRRSSAGSAPSEASGRSSARAVERAAEDALRQRERTDALLARADEDLIAARHRMAAGAEERYQEQVEAIERERQTRKTELDYAVKQGDLTEAQRKRVEAAEEAVRRQQEANARDERADNLVNEALDRQLAEIDMRGRALDLAGQMARTAGERRDVELRLLDLQLEEERARLNAIRKSSGVSPAQREIAQRQLDELDRLQPMAEAAVRQRNLSGLGRFADDIPRTIDEVNEELSVMAADGLESLSTGLADAIVNARSLGDVARNVFRQMASDLLASTIRQSITGPLAAAIGGRIPGFANGTKFFGGGEAVVGERGPELLRLPRGSQIIPNHMLNPRLPQPRPDFTVVQPVHFDLSGAVVTDDLLAQVNTLVAQGAVVSANVGSAKAQAAIQRRSQRSLR